MPKTGMLTCANDALSGWKMGSFLRDKQNKVRRRHWIPWNWNYGWLWATTTWELNLGLVQENLLLPAETPLQLPNSGIDTTHSKITQRSYVRPFNLTQINDHREFVKQSSGKQLFLWVSHALNNGGRFLKTTEVRVGVPRHREGTST